MHHSPYVQYGSRRIFPAPRMRVILQVKRWPKGSDLEILSLLMYSAPMEEQIEKVLKGMLDALGVSYESVSHSVVAGQTVFSIQTADAPALIGGRGDTIHALDLLVKKMYEKQHPTPEGEEDPRFLIDVNDYQVKRIQELQTKALMMADRARSLQYDVELNPMSAYERLIVHTTLQEESHVKTESVGEGRDRRVVIKYSAE